MSKIITKADFQIREGYEPGLIGRVGELHGRYYAQAWGAVTFRDPCYPGVL